MFAIPKKGIYRSVGVHNSDLYALCDWIEGSALFQEDEELFASDVVDALYRGEIYEDQSLAWVIVTDAWNELRRRQEWLGNGCPVEVDDLRLTRVLDWGDAPGHSFCLALAFAKWYPDWARSFGPDFTEQGELFELFTKESLQRILPGWEIHLTGWARTRPNKLPEVVSEVATRLGESIGDLSRWSRTTANEAGLDLLCYRPFPDRRVGVPVYLTQCASGRDWKHKLHTPNLELWTKIVEFASKPKKAFATPFALRDDEFVITCNLLDGLLVDRYRLLSPSRENPNWIPKKLKDRLVRWLKPRIKRLKDADK